MNDCNCNDNYDKIRKKLDECNKNIKYCYIQGPTGPKGEKGDSGTIGKTITGEEGSEAKVINTGTDKGIILDFTIPKGLQGNIGPKGDTGIQGPRGEIGPTGPQGETGISEVITIDGTETIEPNELAEVQDDFDGNIHHLTFYIPKGEKGDSGTTALYNASVFINVPETTVSGIAALEAKTKIPNTNDYFIIKDNRNINIQKSGTYEINVNGKITGVTSSIGASFYLYDVTNDKKLINFELKKGNISEMNFSKTNILEITNQVELQLKTEIENNANDVTFSDIIILIKKYNI